MKRDMRLPSSDVVSKSPNFLMKISEQLKRTAECVRLCAAVLRHIMSGPMRSALNSHILDEWRDFPSGLMSSVSTQRSWRSGITLRWCVLGSAEQCVVEREKKIIQARCKGPVVCKAFNKCVYLMGQSGSGR